VRLPARMARANTLLPLLLAVALFCLPLAGNAYYTSIMIIVAVHTIVVVGLCLLMGYAGQVSLGQGAFYGLGAFISGILSATYGVQPWVAMAIAAAVTGTLAFGTAFPIFRLRGHYLAMATLGLGIITYIFFVELKDYTGGPSGLPGIPYLAIGPLVFDTDFKFYYLAWSFTLAVLLLSRNIVDSRVGRAMRAIHGNEDAARSLGIDINDFKMKVFVLSAVYASIAGSLYAHYTTFVSPQPFGFLASVRFVVMVVLGGLASIWGAVFGTLTVTFLGDMLQPFGEMDTVVFGLILILVMIFMPQGLFRGVVETYERRSSLRTRTGRAGKALARRLGGFRRTSPEPKEQPAVSASGENGPGEAAQRAPTHGGTPKPQGEV
jgi:branched-chain amino acid transport system permease protein